MQLNYKNTIELKGKIIGLFVLVDIVWMVNINQACQWHATDQWFSPGTPVSPTNKTDRHDITEILLKVALNTINQTKQYKSSRLS
jgi:hypothetical protein